jgi:hypothetical protein
VFNQTEQHQRQGRQRKEQGRKKTKHHHEGHKGHEGNRSSKTIVILDEPLGVDPESILILSIDEWIPDHLRRARPE